MSYHKVNKFLNDKITIYRKGDTTDQYGGIDSKWNKKYWGVRCRIYKTGGSLKLSYGGKEYNIVSKLICERDIDMQMGDKIVDDKFGISYIIVGVYNIQGMKKVHHIEALLAREQ